MNKIRVFFSKQYSWYTDNFQKIILILGLHLLYNYLAQLPYINIFTGLFSFWPYLLDWIAVLILFKPSRDYILRIGLFLFVIGFLFGVVKLDPALEIIGQAGFFAIGTYFILSLRELKK